MSYKISQLYEALNRWAPFNTAEEWDNVGLNLGNMSAEVSRVLIALDIDRKTMDVLDDHDVDLVITHHPLLYKPLSSIRYNDDMGFVLKHFLSRDINLICAHTNLDKAEGGVNHCLIEAFQLNARNKKYIGRDIGLYFKNKDHVTIQDLMAKFDMRRAGSKTVDTPHKIGVCGGSGHGLVRNLVEKGIDCFITGEVNYHDEVFCELNGITLLLMGHKESENFILPKIKEKLVPEFPGLEIEVCL